jgi:hypothetical protein
VFFRKTGLRIDRLTIDADAATLEIIVRILVWISLWITLDLICRFGMEWSMGIAQGWMDS